MNDIAIVEELMKRASNPDIKYKLSSRSYDLYKAIKGNPALSGITPATLFELSKTMIKAYKEGSSTHKGHVACGMYFAASDLGDVADQFLAEEEIKAFSDGL